MTCNGANTSMGISGAAEISNGVINGFGIGISASSISQALTVRKETLTKHGTYAIAIGGNNLVLTDSVRSTYGSRGVDGQSSTGTYLVTGRTFAILVCVRRRVRVTVTRPLTV